MARLSDVYKSKNNREIVLTNFQAQVFEAVIEKFKREGVGGDDIFEETYVLQKDIAEYITGNIAEGGGAVGGLATQTYNFILGIEAAEPVIPDPIVEEEIAEEEDAIEELPVSPSPVFRPIPKPRPFRPKKPIRRKPTRPRTPLQEIIKNRGLPISVKPSRPSFSGFGAPRPGGRSFAEALRNRGGSLSKFRGLSGFNFGNFGR